MSRGFKLKPPVTCEDVEQQAKIDRESQNPVMRVLLILANHFKRLLLAIGFVMLVAIFLFIWLEDSYSLTNPFDWVRGIYWAETTRSSTGYGDISPASLPGMVMVATFMALMFLLNTLFQAAVTARLVVEADKFTHREQEDDELDRKNTRAMVQLSLEITLGWFPRDASSERVLARIEYLKDLNIMSNEVILNEMERQAKNRAENMKRLACI